MPRIPAQRRNQSAYTRPQGVWSPIVLGFVSKRSLTGRPHQPERASVRFLAIQPWASAAASALRLIVLGQSLVLLVSLTWTLPLHAQPSVPLAADRDQIHSEALRRALDSRLDVDYDELTLPEVVARWRTELAINVVVDHKHLAESGIPEDAGFSLNMTKVRFESLLDTISELLSIDYVVQPDHLLITSPERAAEKLQIRAYPVQDLILTVDKGDLFQQPYVTSIIPINPQAVLQSRAATGVIATDYDTLVDVISSTVDVDTWEYNGGTGTLEAVPASGCLVVSASPRGHRKLHSFLESLRAARDSQGIEALPPNVQPAAVQPTKPVRPIISIPAVGHGEDALPEN